MRRGVLRTEILQKTCGRPWIGYEAGALVATYGRGHDGAYGALRCVGAHARPCGALRLGPLRGLAGPSGPFGGGHSFTWVTEHQPTMNPQPGMLNELHACH